MRQLFYYGLSVVGGVYIAQNYDVSRYYYYYLIKLIVIGSECKEHLR